MGELTDDQYRDAVELCRRVVTAATSDDGGPTVAGSSLGALRVLLASATVPAGEGPRLTPGLHEGLRWRTGHKTPHLIRILMSGDVPDLAAWPGGDPPIGFFTDPTHAARAVEAVNLVRAGLCGAFDSLTSQVKMLTAENERLQNDLGEQRAHLQSKIAEVTRSRDALAEDRIRR